MIHREVLGAVLGKLLVLRALEMLEGGRGPLTTLKALPGGEFAITGISHSLTHQRAKGQSQCLAGLGTHSVLFPAPADEEAVSGSKSSPQPPQQQEIDSTTTSLALTAGL